MHARSLAQKVVYSLKKRPNLPSPTTVFPQVRPAGIIFLSGLQLRVLLERGYYSRASIIF